MCGSLTQPTCHAIMAELRVDAVGVGLWVIDMLREHGLWATTALFTGSDKFVPCPGNTITIEKNDMVAQPPDDAAGPVRPIPGVDGGDRPGEGAQGLPDRRK